MAKPRLYVETDLTLGKTISIDGDAHHYISRVMRMRVGALVEIFNGSSDGFDAEIVTSDKRTTQLAIISVATPFRMPPNLTLAFAPIKKARTDFIIEKATELGVRNIIPVVTQFTNSERLRVDKLTRYAIEAAEQCGGTFVPSVSEPVSFSEFLKGDNGQILFCDETANTGEGVATFATTKADHWTIIIGPEGGFSPSEREALIAAGALRISLGPRILRADTAAIAAITLWQNTHGDW